MLMLALVGSEGAVAAAEAKASSRNVGASLKMPMVISIVVDDLL